MIDLNQELEDFDAYFFKRHGELPLDPSSEEYANKSYLKHEMFKAWKARAKAQAVPENTEDWYLNEDEGLWLDHDGIDGTLCELGIGEVKPVKHKEYLITQSNTLYAARVWNSDDDHIAWKLFESEESALEAANYCKQMYEASESGAANE
ncbi:hypothetical protein [Acinetobacter baumannii]|uniref:hypothetical protein n=1 Tax=Acinetobacter baumannii TaxID=470 RepID=UPI0038925A6A